MVSSSINMDFSTVCRTCLSKKSLNPIFRDQENHSRYFVAVYDTTGVKVQIDDELPQNMCTTCINYINDSLKFRKKCKDIEAELLTIKLEQNMLDSKVLNRRRNNKIIKTKRKHCISNNNYTNIEVNLRDNESDTEIKTEYVDCEDEDDRPLIHLNDNVKSEEEREHNYIPELELTKNKLEVLKDDIAKTKSEEKHEHNNLTELERTENKLESYKDEFVTENSEVEYEHNDIIELETTKNKLELLKDEFVTDYCDSIIDSKQKRVTCKLCQKNLSVRSIDTHMIRSHPGADERRVKCDLCDNYVMKKKLNRHLVMMHGSGCYRCGYCKAEFDSKDLLIKHVSNCTAKKKKRKASESGRELHECDVCHKKMQKASLRMHKAIKHAGLGPVCEHCGKRFGNKFRLNEHYRAKHGYEKFKCSTCDFQSAGVMAMRNHERRHRGEKPYVCESCGAKFHAAYLLTQHKQSHRTEKLVKCELCPAIFKANNSLHMHKITCHSTSLYKCIMCSRAYSCRHYAVKHLRHVHDFRGPVPKLQRIPSSVETSAEIETSIT